MNILFEMNLMRLFVRALVLCSSFMSDFQIFRSMYRLKVQPIGMRELSTTLDHIIDDRNEIIRIVVK